MKETQCIVCNESAKIALEDFNGYSEGEKFDIYYCSSCNTSFAWPHLVVSQIYDVIYSNPDIVPGYNRYALYAKEIISKKNALDYLASKEPNYYSVREILRQTNKNAKILEVGSGLGYLTYAVTQSGYDIIGLDISMDAVKRAENQFGAHYVCGDVYQYALDNPAAFDLVILTEVIEHLPDPVNFCDALINLLKPGGKLIITTPNKSAFPQHEYWNTELPPVHLTWFSEDSFKMISKQKNLGLSFFDFTNFNKKHFDNPAFKYHEWYMKRYKIGPTLSKEGKVLQPKDLIDDTLIKKIKTNLKRLVRSIVEPIIIFAFTGKTNRNRSNALCVILEKNSQ
ncbi:MAG: class I SAM-dependent methyltransferase [Ginsengibacter sp.]